MAPSPKVQAVIRELIATGLATDTRPGVREAILATGGLPVDLGWTGTTMVHPDGTVVFYDEETKSTEHVLDRVRRRGALRRLSLLDPRLRETGPVRFAHARDCPPCSGTGRILVERSTFDCGECDGVGWRD